MNSNQKKNPYVAIACGGTGGHLFPGLAVAGQLQQRGCDVALLISPKDVDQQAVKSVGVQASACPPNNTLKRELQPGAPFEIFTLPAVGLQNRNYFSFAGSFVKSLFAARKIFRRRQPSAVLAMGGFTSAPPVFVAKDLGVKTFLHESNTIPGKANRFLARFVDEAFVGFPEAAARLKTRKVTRTGTPVRPQFQFEFRAPGLCRTALGLEADRPTILVVGGSQGASGLNAMVLSALPLLAQKNWQWLHLTGANDFERVKSAYAALGLNAVVKPFLAEMDLARLPSLLVPLPTSADNHQYFNAIAFEKTGAAHLFSQKQTPPKQVEGLMIKMLAGLISRLVENAEEREKIQAALVQWHAPNSAAEIAENILRAVLRGAASPSACSSHDLDSRTSCPRSA